MRRALTSFRPFVLFLLAACGNRAGRAPVTPPTSASVPPAIAVPPGGEDITAHYRAMQEKYGAPPAPSRQGHVEPLKSAATTTRDAHGFKVKFPSNTLVTTPAAYKGKILVSGGFGSKEFYAIEASTGQPAWALTLDDDGPSSPACDEDVCVFNTESCTTFAVDARTGTQLWAWWLGDPLTSSPAITKGRAFTSYPSQQGAAAYTSVAPQEPPLSQSINVPRGPAPDAPSHVLAAFDLKTGRVLWQRWLDSDVMSSPVAVGDELLVTTFGGTLLRFEQSTGAIRAAIKTRATSAPVVANGAVYFSTRTDAQQGQAAQEGIARADEKGQQVTAQKAAPYLDARVQATSHYAEVGKSSDSGNGFSGGAPSSANSTAAVSNIGQASVSTMQAFQGSRVLVMGNRSYSSMGDELVATDAQNGQKLWSFKLAGDVAQEGGFLAAPPAAAGGKLVVSTLKGEVLVVDPSDGKVAARHPVGHALRSQPIVVDGWIYVGTEDGALVAIDTRDRSLTGWTMWGGNAARTGTP